MAEKDPGKGTEDRAGVAGRVDAEVEAATRGAGQHQNSQGIQGSLGNSFGQSSPRKQQASFQ